MRQFWVITLKAIMNYCYGKDVDDVYCYSPRL